MDQICSPCKAGHAQDVTCVEQPTYARNSCGNSMLNGLSRSRWQLLSARACERQRHVDVPVCVG